MHNTKKESPFFRNWMKAVKPFWISLSAGLGVMACMSSANLPSATPLPYIASAAPILKEAPVFERVEDYGQFPVTISEPTGPLNLLPPNDPLLVDARIRGIQWPMVANRGSSLVYPRQRGVVSYYHESQNCATGEDFDPRGLTGAHKSLPFGTIVRCTRTDTGQSVIIMINDRGPYVRGRILDLSPCAARELELTHDGVATCMVEVLAYPLIETMGPKGNG